MKRLRKNGDDFTGVPRSKICDQIPYGNTGPAYDRRPVILKASSPRSPAPSFLFCFFSSVMFSSTSHLRRGNIFSYAHAWSILAVIEILRIIGTSAATVAPSNNKHSLVWRHWIKSACLRRAKQSGVLTRTVALLYISTSVFLPLSKHVWLRKEGSAHGERLSWAFFPVWDGFKCSQFALACVEMIFCTPTPYAQSSITKLGWKNMILAVRTIAMERLC